MKLSTKGRYAVMAMTDLAQQGERRAVALAEIAARQEISLPYLEQLFARLRRKGVVESVRGPGGGYRLARPAASTTVAEVINAVDEPLRVTRCLKADKGCMKGGAQCGAHALWDALGRRIEDYLSSVTLADVAQGNVAGNSGRAPAEAA